MSWLVSGFRNVLQLKKKKKPNPTKNQTNKKKTRAAQLCSMHCIGLTKIDLTLSEALGTRTHAVFHG